jgi:hypothetical protein
MKSNEFYDYSKTDRSRFNDSFLVESPQKHNPTEYFDNLNLAIQEYINCDIPIIRLGNNLCKIELESGAFYWFEKDENPVLIVELEKAPRTLIVRLLGKKGKGAPYAVDLYLAILKDVGRNITIMSDNQITEKGLNVWKRLFDMGHKITVYDNTAPGSTWKTLNSADDLEEYFGDEYKYRNYRYVLSEGKFIHDTRSFFRLRQTREEHGSALED